MDFNSFEFNKFKLVDGVPTPFASVEEALLQSSDPINPVPRDQYAEKYIQPIDEPLQIYWYRDGIADEDLILKATINFSDEGNVTATFVDGFYELNLDNWNGELSIEGNSGIQGQVLMSNGEGNSISWENIDYQETGSFKRSGGIVTWITGYTYNVSPAIYYINGVRYTSISTNHTLSASDPVDGRIDLFALTTSGTSVVIEGVTSPTPEEPDIDPDTQLKNSFAIVEPLTSEPILTESFEWVYQENTEWTSSSTANFNVASASSPLVGTVSVEATTAVNGNYVLFTRAALWDASVADYLSFQIKSKGNWGNRKVQIQCFNGTTPVGNLILFGNTSYGFDTSNTTTTQYITIPTSDFGELGIINRVRFRVSFNGGGNIGFWLDNIRFQYSTIILAADSNFANAELTFDDNHTHDLDGNTLTIEDGEVGLTDNEQFVMSPNNILLRSRNSDSSKDGYFQLTYDGILGYSYGVAGSVELLWGNAGVDLQSNNLYLGTQYGRLQSQSGDAGPFTGVKSFVTTFNKATDATLQLGAYELDGTSAATLRFTSAAAYLLESYDEFLDTTNIYTNNTGTLTGFDALVYNTTTGELVRANTSLFGGGWSLTGNAGTTAGTNFLGTTDNIALMFKVNNFKSGYIGNSGNSTSFGYKALLNNNGSSNTGFGNQVMPDTTGLKNVAVGYIALNQLTDGNGNTAIGAQASFYNTSGYYNTSVGNDSLYKTNIGIQNTAVGMNSGYNNTSGNGNVLVGVNALYNNSTGGNNIAIGLSAGSVYGVSSAITDTSNSIYIGHSSKGFSSTDSNSIVIGYTAVGRGTNTTTIGNDDTTSTKLFGILNIETFTPSGSADSAGITGDITWDSSYIYVKTGADAWKRSALSTF